MASRSPGANGRSVRRGVSSRSTGASVSVRARCEHVFVPYVELHAHSAFSFLDGASGPDELAGAAVALGHEALALTDHNGMCGSVGVAQAAAPLGVRAIHRAGMDLCDGRPLPPLGGGGAGRGHPLRLITPAPLHHPQPTPPL